MPTYTVRSRCDAHPGAVGLLVEDGRGTTSLFSGGELQARCAGPEATARLLHLLRHRDCWTAVPAVAPYTLAGLRALTANGYGHATPGGRAGERGYPQGGTSGGPVGSPHQAGSRRR